MAGTAILAVRITGDGSGAQSAMRRTADAARRMSSAIVTAGTAAVFVARNISTISTVAKYGGAALAVLGSKAIASSAALRAAANAARTFAGHARTVAAALFAILPGPVRNALIKLALAMRITGSAAAAAARDIARLASAIMVLRAIGGAVSKVLNLYKALSKVVLAAVPVLGVIAAIGTTAIAAGAALGAALGAGLAGAIGTLGPALGVLKIGMTGLSDAASEFNKQFKDADIAFNKMISQRMAPFLTAMRSMKQAVVGSFSQALTPAFAKLGTLVGTLQPQLAGLASEMGGMFSGIAAKLPTGAFQTMISSSKSFIASIGPGVANLTAGLSTFGATASTVFARMGPAAGAALDSIGAKLAAIRPDQIEKVFSTVSQAFTNIGNVLGPVFGLMSQLGPIVSSSMAPAFVAVGAAIGQATPALSNMAQVIFPALSQVIQNLAPIIPILANAFTPWVTVLAAIAPLLATMAVALAPMAPAILAIAIAVKVALAAQAIYNTAMLLYSNAGKIATAVQWAWNVAMSANPIGLIVVAVVALIAVIVLIATKTTWFQTIWEKLKVAGVAVWEAIKIAAAFVWAAIQQYVQIASAVIGAVIGAVVAVVTGYFNIVQAVVSTVFNVISTIVTTVAGVIGSVIGGAIDIVVGAFNTAQSVGEAVFGVIKGAIDLVGNAINTIIGFVQNLINALSNISFPSPPSWLGDLFGGAVGPQLVGVPPTAGLFRFLPPAVTGFAAPAPDLTAASPSIFTGAFGNGSQAPPQVTNITITVQGAIDPQATAQQIKNILTGRDRTVGAAAAVDLRLGVA